MSNTIVRWLGAGLLVGVLVSLTVLAVQLRPILPAVSPPRPASPPDPLTDSRCREASVVRHSEDAPREIYRAVFDWLRHAERSRLRAGSPQPVVVVESPSLKLPAVALVQSSREFSSLSAGMREALADGIDSCVVLDPRNVPAEIVILDADEIDAADPRGVWERLGRRVPGATRWMGLSQPLLSGDRLDAVVYVARFCHGCGQGRYLWLQRGETGRWRVRASFTTWMS